MILNSISHRIKSRDIVYLNVRSETIKWRLYRECPLNVVIGEDFIKGMKKQTTKWEKILASQKTDKGLKKKDNPKKKNGQETCSGILQNRIFKCSIIICVPKYIYEISSSKHCF